MRKIPRRRSPDYIDLQALLTHTGNKRQYVYVYVIAMKTPMKPKTQKNQRGTFLRRIIRFSITGGTILFFLLLLFAAVQNHKPYCKNCNVVLVSLDTLSGKHLPCYGYDRNTAPYLCRIAKENTYFSRAYTQSHYTLPSHLSLFTGQYPSTHGFLDPSPAILDQKTITLTEALKAQGYQTLYFGPTDNDFFPLSRGLERGFSYIDDEYNYLRTGELQNWGKGVEMLKENTNKGIPTFLFLHTYFVHEPYLPETRDNHFSDRVDLSIPVTAEEYTAITPAYLQFVKDYFRQNPADSTPQEAVYQKFLRTDDFNQAKPLYQYLMTTNCKVYCLQAEYYYTQNKDDPHHIAYIRSIYDEMIFKLDKEIGKLVADLEPLLKKNTILVITADHGEAFMEHRDIMHRSLYSEVLNVPLVVIAPNVHRGEISAPASLIDIYPTVLGLLGLPKAASIEGNDLSPLLSRLPVWPDYKPVISERYAMQYTTGKHEPILQRSIISGKWKLLIIVDQQSTRDAELYDLISDPDEKQNIAGKRPDVVNRLLRIHQKFSSDHPVQSFPSSETPPDPPPENPERLFHY